MTSMWDTKAGEGVITRQQRKKQHCTERVMHVLGSVGHILRNRGGKHVISISQSLTTDCPG